MRLLLFTVLGLPRKKAKDLHSIIPRFVAESMAKDDGYFFFWEKSKPVVAGSSTNLWSASGDRTRLLRWSHKP